MFSWLVKLFRFFFPDYNTRELERLREILDQINEKADYYKHLSDAELRNSTYKFRKLLLEGATLEDIKIDVFATVRESATRVLKMRHFDVQILGGLALHEGKIVEMKTGEGKTLVATLPLYLNALELNPEWLELAKKKGITEFIPLVNEKGMMVPVGRGAILVTVNDYLAKRDAEWMGPLYKFLGMSVGLNIHGMSPEEKRAAYAADITYGTNNEFGFDYLRDNLAHSLEECVQRPEFNYAIVDEVDSILIDEARTPLIISGPAEKATNIYYLMARLVKDTLKEGRDYILDEKHHGVSITEEGITRVEQALGIQNLYDNKNMELVHHLHNAIKAKHFYHKDKEYIVRDRPDGKGKEVIIVDEFTGRLMFGRRYSDGLHQAIEAKEGVEIQQENQTLASITFQNYFRMYRKLAGMTGTAETEAKEFKEIYNCDVIVIPPNKPCIRIDHPDVIYRTAEEKFEAIVNHILEIHKRKQPVLVGTISIEKSEMLARMLRERGVECQVLNAKYHEKEAEIIAQAGREGAITIATNMAGRGTDILLGGNPEMLAYKEVGKKEGPEYEEALKKYRQICAEEKERVIKAGGLFIIGTERHEARRIDNQLRGRAGRQGDPGESQFYLSLEDDLMRLFGSSSISSIMEKLGWQRGEPIYHPWITKSIENAQKRVENHHFEIRKHVLKYDDVMNQQRQVIYKERRKALEQEDVHEDILNMAYDLIEDIVNRNLSSEIDPEEWDYKSLHDQLLKIFPLSLSESEMRKYSKDELIDLLKKNVTDALDNKRNEIGVENFKQLEKYILLEIVDSKWKDHLHNMDQLQEGIHLRSWGQRDPLVEYKIEAFQMFQEMIESIKEDVLFYLFRLQFSSSEEQKRKSEQPRELYYNRGDEESPEIKQKPKKAADKIGRNDPCPCGSGKKYKKCCGINLN